MKVVVDTNVFVSGIFWKGAPRGVLALWEHKKFTLVLSDEILDEYTRVLQKLNRKFQLEGTEEILHLVSVRGVFYSPSELDQPKCDDPKDQMFLNLAAFARAPYLVS